MNTLIACEQSGRVRREFCRRGYTDVFSCDLEPSEDKSQNHLQIDLRDAIGKMPWDLIIAFPPCTHLASSGARWFKEKRADGRQQAAVEFFMMIANHDAEMIAIENPVGIMSSEWRKPDQIIQPWMFGHGETKSTCLWLKNLPRLEPTDIVEGREPVCWKMPPSPDRAKNRSLTYQGVARAMSIQWGAYAKTRTQTGVNNAL